MPRAPTMKDLQSRLDVIQRDIDKLEAQKELVLEMMGQDQEPKTTSRRAKKGSVKQAVLHLLEEAGERGLNANTAITKAKERGVKLDRGSVSSLLSRLKADGIVSYEDEFYRLKKFSRAARDSSSVTPLRTSGGSMFD